MKHRKIFGSIFLCCGIFGFSFMIGNPFIVKAQSNEAPTIESVYISNSANAHTDDYSGGTIDSLVSGGASTLHINGIVQDLNGRDEIVEVKATFFRTGVTGGGSCSQSDRDCYRTLCDLSNNSDPNQKLYDCAINVKFFADSTSVGGAFPDDNWTVAVKVQDPYSENSNSSVTKEMQTLLALDIPNVNYGLLSVGQATTSENNVDQVFTQQGNDEADVEVSAENGLICDIRGIVPIENQHWSLLDYSYVNENTIALSGTVTDTDLYVGYQADSSPTTKSIFWNVRIPDSGLKGVCTGSTTITVIPH